MPKGLPLSELINYMQSTFKSLTNYLSSEANQIKKYCASSLIVNSLDLRTHTTHTFYGHYHKGTTSIYNGQLLIAATFIEQLLS
jgi:hypothetical protein